ncbi:hypothetical protein B0I35DRAFT_477963 [Stachybotrys elegans]|uniref:Uncharacterized protein n=1 Tax=Stachybotrys elegans TaxID=80388 RepID=A0A8K0SVK3_9HYPO|nr:hypothetical protein B0I35DRAFT_477963 [Stachybotrys elegans]
MRFSISAMLGLVAAAAAASPPRPPSCDMASACPEGQQCAVAADRPSSGYTCIPLNDYPSCGGYRIEPQNCDSSQVCIDDPRIPGCGMACDRPGICVNTGPPTCIGGDSSACPSGTWCYNHPQYECNPGGRKPCPGICL